jgi:hypothetical protein
MKERPADLLSESLTALLARHYRVLADSQRGVSFESFSDDVLALYEQRTPVDQRVVGFSREQDHAKRQKINAQNFRRWFGVGRSVGAPLDLFECFVLGLPRESRQALQADLGARLGWLIVDAPDLSAGQDMLRFSEVVKDFGLMCSALAPIFSDNALTQADRPLVPEALAKIRELIIAALGLQAQLEAVLSAEADE